MSAPYYTVCDGCSRPSGVGNITLTNPNYQIYHGVDLTATKRFSNRWQMQAALTIQNNPSYFPDGIRASFINPTGVEFQEGVSTIRAIPLQGCRAATRCRGTSTSRRNLNMNDGATRTLTINGPGGLRRHDRDHQPTTRWSSTSTGRLTRSRPIKLLDLGVQKVFQFNGGRQRIKLMLDGFNMFNVNTITAYVSGNQSLAGFTQPNTIVPPRVFRVGTQFVF